MNVTAGPPLVTQEVRFVFQRDILTMWSCRSLKCVASDIFNEKCVVEETGMGLSAFWGMGGCGPPGGPWVAINIIVGWVCPGW
ncbi:hypothetical protein EYF80_030654 [Liparis tanakae]|uniref:Uncharacterized protein n=1 Tax=Liparis tanakae TaxID=230148 RepID=A0A4Z2H0Y6_9TELE|nr:hypothetical protein EYF80_030654 [Liparis tanakae]